MKNELDFWKTRFKASNWRPSNHDANQATSSLELLEKLTPRDQSTLAKHSISHPLIGELSILQPRIGEQPNLIFNTRRHLYMSSSLPIFIPQEQTSSSIIERSKLTGLERLALQLANVGIPAAIKWLDKDTEIQNIDAQRNIRWLFFGITASGFLFLFGANFGGAAVLIALYLFKRNGWF